jgi:gentisate 1,2-dioxygenase
MNILYKKQASEQVLQEQSTQQKWELEANFKEYMSAVNPPMPKINVVDYPASIHQQGPTKITSFDLSKKLNLSTAATTPNLLANFIRICASETLKTSANATSQMFYVINGCGKTQMSEGSINWKTGDLFTLPALVDALHTVSEDTALYWVTDSPLMDYLGVKPNKSKFNPVLYTREKLTQELDKVKKSSANKNRMGILLNNPNFPKTLTITHTLWALYNSLPAGVSQKAHRHNSVALDFCVTAGENTYTLISKDIDDDGNLIKPIKAMWTPGSAFVTPPGWWHSHHNESDEDAIVLPIQDAGLIMNMQVLDFQYIK